MSLLSHQGLLMAAGGGGGGSFFDEVMARNPLFWWRHNEASGSVMTAEVGVAGTYLGNPGLGQSAIYTGGGTCIRPTPSGWGDYAGILPTLNELSIITIIKFTALTGFRGMVGSDDGGLRHWQHRMNGTDYEFIKIAGGVATVAAGTSLSTGVTYLLGCSVSAAGIVKLYNGASLLVTSSGVGVANYGGNSHIEIGYMGGGGGALADAFMSESLIFDTELSGTDFSVLTAAAGL